MFHLNLPPAPQVALASVSRVFLTSLIPGWVGQNGNVHLPLRMDGSGTDLGISASDSKGLEAWFRGQGRYFASTKPHFEILPSEELYRSVIQPPWYAAIVEAMDKTIRAYGPTVAKSSPFFPVINSLSERWERLTPLITGSLYLCEGGRAPGEFLLTPQDLCLYGDPIDEDDLWGHLHLFDTFAHVEALLATGLFDRIEIQSGKAKKELHDAGAESTPTFIDATTSDGRMIQIPKGDLRPVCLFEADKNGDIDPLQAGGTTAHIAYEEFLLDITQQNRLLMGAYLLSHFKIEGEEIQELSTLFAREKSAGLDLFPAPLHAKVVAYLRKTGRGIGAKDDALARFVAETVRRALSSS